MGNSIKIKTPRDAKGVDALKLLEKTTTSVYQSRISPKSASNTKHCHTLHSSRDVKRIDRNPWEKRVAALLRIVEKHRFDRVNALHNALQRVNLLLAEGRIREDNLKDMTVELEKTGTYLKTLMDSMADMLIVTNRDGIITEVNRTAERLSGYSKKALLGSSFPTFFSDPEKAATGIQSVLREMTLYDFEVTLLSKTGSKIPLMLNATVLTGDEGMLSGVLINARDVGELKQAQTAREQYAKELARANADLEEFASLASHELKEPLKKVISHAESLAAKYHDLFDQEAIKDLTFMVDQTHHMQSLIKHVLDYARVETEDAVHTAIDCEKVLKQALINLSGTLEESPVKVYHDPLPYVTGDDGQLIRLFQNLTANAIKYHDPNKSNCFVKLQAERIEKSDIQLPPSSISKGWLFSVSDNGIGIDPDFQPDIFKMFVRLHSKDQYGGEGMGLAIVRRIIRRHGGNIWVASEVGIGSTFYFTLAE